MTIPRVLVWLNVGRWDVHLRIEDIVGNCIRIEGYIGETMKLMLEILVQRCETINTLLGEGPNFGTKKEKTPVKGPLEYVGDSMGL
jgi:hypothetical protein|tara:strand:- start:2328 stop:2585 length:258 start_codon:yes stop_codon:yes gene_type:complete